MSENEDSFDNLDELDWGDVEDELQASRKAIISEAAQSKDSSAEAGVDLDQAINQSLGDTDSNDSVESDLDINFLLDVELQISVEVGRTRMLIQDLLELDKSSIVELNSLIGEPLDIRVNEELIARGEVVVMNDKFAVRIIEIVSPKERFSSIT